MMGNDAMSKKKIHNRFRRQRGNAIVMLFAAIGMAGIVTYGLNNVMRGPATTTAEISRRSMAENNLVATTRLAISAATHQQANSGDCDGDGFVEPVPFRDAGGLGPVGGGWVPASVGASMMDPWGNQYGYCVWDPGTATVSDNVTACGGSAALRLEGAPRDDQPAIAVISAGKNGIFETQCNAYVDGNNDNVPDSPLVDKNPAGDDIVLSYTYAEANGIGGGEWKIKDGSPNTAEISKDIEIGSASHPSGASFTGALELSGARGLILPRDPGNDSVTGACDAAKDSQLRLNINDGSEVPTLEICFGGAWVTVSGGASTGQQCVGDLQQWEASSAPSVGWYQISMSTDGEFILAHRGNTSLMYSHDGGGTWTATALSANFADIDVAGNGQVAYAAIAGDTIRKSVDGGVTWTATASGSRNWQTMDTSEDGSVIAATVQNGRLYVSTNGGANWSTATGVNQDWWDVAVSKDGTHITGLVHNGTLYVSTDSGASFTSRGGTSGWGPLAMSADGMVQAAMDIGGSIILSTDGGTNWAPSSSGTSGNWWEIAVSDDGSTIVATIDGGVIRYSTDQGVTWQDSASGTRNWYGITISGDGTKAAAVENGGGIYISNPVCGGGPTAPVPSGVCAGDGTWTSQTIVNGWTDVTISDDGSTILAAGGSGPNPEGGVYLSTNGGQTYNRVDQAASYNGIFVAMSGDAQRMVAAAYNGIARYSTNGGSSWANSNSGNQLFDAMSMSKDGMTALAAIYAGDNNSIWRSTNGGATWTNIGVVSYSGAENTVSLSGDGQTAVFAGQNHAIDVSTNGGASFTNISYYASNLFLDSAISADGQVMVIGETGGKIFVSTNRGVTWVRRNSLPNGNWAVDISDDGNTIIAGSEIGVYLSNDLGVTWTKQADVPNDITAVAMTAGGSKLVAVRDDEIWMRICQADSGADSSISKNPHPLDADMVGRWKMDEGSGSVVADTEGNNDGAFINTPNWTTEAPQGQSSLFFDSTTAGVGDGILINSDFGRPTKGTIALWANIQGIDSAGGGADLFNLADVLILRHEAARLRFYYRYGGSYRALPATLKERNLLGTGWHHIVATFDDDADMFRLYVDGIALDQATYTDAISYNTGSTITRLGKQISGDSYDLNGGLDDVRLYNRALGPGEVAALYERVQGQSFVRPKALGTSPIPARQGMVSTSGLGAHTCATKPDGSLWCWGSNANGRLGINSTVASADVPRRVQQQSIHNFHQISTGRYSTCGVTADGTGWCWGTDADGQLGNGATTGDQIVPSQVAGGGVWSQISAGGQHACGVRQSGVAYCWGLDTSQQLGNGASTTTQTSPVTVNGGGLYALVRAGLSHSCGIRVDGSAWCWGLGTSGQLGNAASATQNAPVAVLGNLQWKDLSLEATRTCGVTVEGGLWCWGTGYGNTPVPLEPGEVWSDVKVGTNHICASKIDGSLWCLGDDTHGSLGNDSAASTAQAMPMRAILSGPVASFTAGNDTTCAMLLDNSLWCWGADNTGSLGNGSTTADQFLPVMVSNFQAPAPWVWNTAANAFKLNAGVSIALGNDKWISPSGNASYFGFESAGKARLRQTASSNQLLIETGAAGNSAQASFKRGTASPAPTDATTGSMIAEWQFNQSSGTNVPSATGSFPGTASGSYTWNTTGDRQATGNVLEFDGLTGRVSVANSATFRPSSGSYTIAVWVRPDGYQKDGATILSKSYNNGANHSYALTVTADQKVAFVTTSTGPAINTLFSDVPLRPNAWTKIEATMTYSGANINKTLRINGGNEVTSGTVPGPMYSTNATGNLFFGSAGCLSTCKGFRGAVDDFRIHNAAWTAAVSAAAFAAQTSFITPKAIGIDHGTNNLEAVSQNATATNWVSSISPGLSLTSSGNVGAGIASPSMKVEASGGVRVGYQSAACTSSTEGAIRYTGNVGDEPITYRCSATSWTIGAIPSDSFNAITYGNGRFMAVSTNASTTNVYMSLDGITWTALNTGVSAGWEGIAYGNGAWVAVGTNSSAHIMTSTNNGATWTSQAGPADRAWRSVTFANGIFVATSTDTTPNIMTSVDGINWTVRAAPGSLQLARAAFGNGAWVALGSGSASGVRSTDNGATWTAVSASSNSTWNSITYGSGLFVAVSTAGLVSTSPDGITWTARTAAAANNWFSVNYHNGVFVALGSTGAQRIMISSNGINWTGVTAPQANAWLASAYGAGRIVGVSQNGTNRSMISECPPSPQGTASLPAGAVGYWKFDETSGLSAADSAGTNPGTLSGSASFGAGMKGNGLVLSGGYVSMGSATNIDNVRPMTACAWVRQTSITPSIPQMIFNKTANNGLSGWSLFSDDFDGNSRGSFGYQMTTSSRYVEKYDQLLPGQWVHTCASWDGSSGFDSIKLYVDGAEQPAPYDRTATPNAATTDAAYNLTVGAAGAGGYPFNGTIDEVILYNRVLTPAEIQQVMANTGDPPDTNTQYTCTGQGWALQGTTSAVISLAYGNGLFVAAGGYPDELATSPDGVTWTGRSPPGGTGWFSDITYGNGQFVAVANSGPGRVVTSPDGINWTARTAAAANSWEAITYGGGLYVAVSSSGANRVMTSPDGITWTAQSAPLRAWTSIAYGNGIFLAISGPDDRRMTSPDGITWTEQPGTNGNGRVAFGDGLFLISANNTIQTTTDGVAITNQTVPSGEWYDMVYHQASDLWIATSWSGTNRVMTSPDAINWTAQSAPTANWNNVAIGNGIILATAGDGSVMTSSCTPAEKFQYCDGSAWRDFGLTSNNNLQWKRTRGSLALGGDWSDNGHSCGILSNGEARCWGDAEDGKLGNNTTSPDQPHPVPVLADSGPGIWNDWVKMSAGGTHTCGIRADGSAWCWGSSDGHSRLGINTTTGFFLRPQRVHTDISPAGWNDWVDISASQEYSCGVRANGTAWCWGNVTYGSIGNYNAYAVTYYADRPVQVDTNTGSPGWSDWVQISTGGVHSCGVRANGTAWCWGDQVDGSLGNDYVAMGLGQRQPRPVQVVNSSGGPGWTDWVEISDTCGRRLNGTVWCWGPGGLNWSGSYSGRPVQVPNASGGAGWTDWIGISGNCGVRADGTAWCWGWNAYGQLGDGTTNDSTNPVQVLSDTGGPGWNDWISIARQGDASTCGVRTDGSAWCWGKGNRYQLGNGSTSDRSLPTQIIPAP